MKQAKRKTKKQTKLGKQLKKSLKEALEFEKGLAAHKKHIEEHQEFLKKEFPPDDLFENLPKTKSELKEGVHVIKYEHGFETEGVKFDEGKVPLDLIPYEALEEIGKVLAHGMKKYQRANWAKGINYSRLIAAALRHLNQYNAGIDKDDETRLSHISHAATNLVFLLWMEKNRPDLDDRWIKTVKKK